MEHLEFVGPAYEPKGKIESGGELAYEYIAPKEPKDYGTVDDIRKMMAASENYFDSQEKYSKYKRDCTITKIENIGGKKFHDLAESTYAYIHRPKTVTNGTGVVLPTTRKSPFLIVPQPSNNGWA